MKDILISTTESLLGWNIEQYIKPVFASVVLGGSLSGEQVSSYNASVARTNNYENQLQNLNDNVLQLIKKKAQEAGANCIVGLRITINEVNSRGASSIIVSGVGTAVIVSNLLSSLPLMGKEEVNPAVLNQKVTLLQLQNRIGDQNYKLLLGDLKAIVESGDPDFKEFITLKLSQWAENRYGSTESGVNKAAGELYQKYFDVIPAESSIEALYNALLNTENIAIAQVIIAIIKENNLVDYEAVKRLLLSDSSGIRKYALYVLQYDKQFYTADDISELYILTDVIKQTFPSLKRVAVGAGYHSLSSESETWACTCGHENDSKREYCSSCGNDSFGFAPNELKPNDIIKALNLKRTALESVLRNQVI